MKNFTDSALSIVDRASSKLGPLSSLLDTFVERVVPNVSASACTGALCKETCSGVRCGHFLVGHRFYSINAAGCNNHFYTCVASFCGC